MELDWRHWVRVTQQQAHRAWLETSGLYEAWQKTPSKPLNEHVLCAIALAQTYTQRHSVYELIRDLIVAVLVLQQLRKVLRFVYGRGIFQAARMTGRAATKAVFRRLMALPFVRTKVDAEVGKTLAKLEVDMIDRSLEFYYELPEKGWADADVLAAIDQTVLMKHSDWESGRVSGAVYHGGASMLKLQQEAYGRYSIGNQLHPDVFPGLRKMESEVVAMALRMFHAPESGCGTTTSGGTESLLMACLAARERAYRLRGVTEPEIIAPVTIHAGFDKAAYYFRMKLVHAPVDPKTFKVDLAAVARLVNSNTVLIAGSAPNYPHGIIDDIEGLSKIAVRHKIPLHVDACLGSFLVPFLAEAGIKNPPVFDFRVPGVTSLSCDTHKYGFAPKGSSLILYRDPDMRAHQYFLATDWSGGVYGSPTLAGSRPGALMAGCWASMMAMGRSGYVESCREIVGAAQELKQALHTQLKPDLYVLGDPIVSVVAFSSTTLNIYDLADAMSAKGWHLAALQNPPAIHMACTRLTVPVIGELVADLKVCVGNLKTKTTRKADGTAAMYGVAGSIQTVGVIDRIATGFIDNLYKLPSA